LAKQGFRASRFQSFKASNSLIAQAFVASLKPCSLETAGVGSGGAGEEEYLGNWVSAKDLGVY
jgi:hypothetical protein